MQKKSGSMSLFTARRVLQVLRTGSSRPVVAEDDLGGRYLVKLHRSQSHPHAQLSELVGNRLAAAAGLPVLTPVWALLEPGTDQQAVDQEVRDVVQKSYGFNLAYPFLERAADVSAAEIIPGEQPWLDLWWFDLLLLHIDRTPFNLNLFRAGGQLYSVDYETSMLVIGILTGKDNHQDSGTLQQLRQNPLYHPAPDPARLQALLGRMQAADVRPMLTTHPENRFAAFSERLQEGLQAALQDEKRMPFLLERVAKLSAEPEEARKARIRKNREAFEVRWKG